MAARISQVELRAFEIPDLRANAGCERSSGIHGCVMTRWRAEPLMVRVVENEGRGLGAEVGELKNL